ncbi:hypothetical protein BS47DRAFT_1356110 [Hydnum rufescens UP504]|uniref:Uncharacterized protein n=1 Tax=Hydnum rufescens UP504 TaxID=1448309 RepID=A0A9P6ACY0_9AGAM|nr:hypothetical protein BS47DRAFT_1356110 [Hydnum rufescens UP504]
MNPQWVDDDPPDFPRTALHRIVAPRLASPRLQVPPRSPVPNTSCHSEDPSRGENTASNRLQPRPIIHLLTNHPLPNIWSLPPRPSNHIQITSMRTPAQDGMPLSLCLR